MNENNPNIEYYQECENKISVRTSSLKNNSQDKNDTSKNQCFEKITVNPLITASTIKEKNKNIENSRKKYLIKSDCN